MRTLPILLRLALPLLAVSTGASCTGHLNRGDGPLGPDALPDLAGALPAAAPQDEQVPVPNRIDRSTWSTTTVRIERRQVEAQPWGVATVHFDRSTARERGEYPAPETVLEGPGDPGQAVAEGFAAPFVAGWDLVASPIRIFFEPPWRTVRTPADPPSLHPAPPTT